MTVRPSVKTLSSFLIKSLLARPDLAHLPTLTGGKSSISSQPEMQIVDAVLTLIFLQHWDSRGDELFTLIMNDS